MDIEEEVQKRLYPVRVSSHDGVYTLSHDNGRVNFRASRGQLRKLLYRIKAKDSDSQPNSRKEIRYLDMVDQIVSKSNYTIYCWKSRLPRDFQHVTELLGD